MKSVAIILATYNGEKYLREQLESIKNQTYSDFVCYIHDDGSTDTTLSICNEYVDKFPDLFVLLDYKTCGGAKKNFFSMVNHVKEKYLLFSDQDDYWEPTKIEKMSLKMEQIEKDFSGPILVYSDLAVVDSNLYLIDKSYIDFTHRQNVEATFNNALIQGFIPGCAMMLNSALYEKLNMYSNGDEIYMHDWWAIALCLALGGKIGYVNKPLVKYRQHSNNTLGVARASCLTAINHLISELATGNLYRNKSEWINRSRNIANQLKNIDGVLPEYKELCENMADISKRNKVERILFYYKNFKDANRIYYMLLWV